MFSTLHDYSILDTIFTVNQHHCFINLIHTDAAWGSSDVIPLIIALRTYTLMRWKCEEWIETHDARAQWHCHLRLGYILMSFGGLFTIRVCVGGLGCARGCEKFRQKHRKITKYKWREKWNIKINPKLQYN